METRDRIIIILVFLITLVLIAGGYFVYFYQNRIDRSAELLKQKEQNQAIRNGCLKENEFTDYPINPKYAIEIKAPLNPLVVSVRDKGTQKEKFSFQIEGINPDHYHPVELHKCGVYVLRKFNYDPQKSIQMPGYREELWRYHYDGIGESVFLLAEKNASGIYKAEFNNDFRIDPNEKYLVLEKGYLGKDDYALIIKDLETKEDIFSLALEEIVKQYPDFVGNFNMRDWSKDSRYFWGDIFDGADVLAMFRIDSTSWKWEMFEVSPYTMGGTALNPEYGYITYDDGPPWTGDIDFDEINKEEWLKEGKRLNFYLYNLFTKENIILTTVDDPLWNFKPKWLSDTELQYELPDGEKKIYKIVKNQSL